MPPRNTSELRYRVNKRGGEGLPIKRVLRMADDRGQLLDVLGKIEIKDSLTEGVEGKLETRTGRFAKFLSGAKGVLNKGEEVLRGLGISEDLLDQVSEFLVGNRRALGAIMRGEHPKWTLEYSNDEGKTWKAERSTRRLFPDSVSEEGIINRLMELKKNQKTILSNPLPDSIIHKLGEYVKEDYISVDIDEKGNLEVTCLDENGDYRPLASSAADIYYALRKAGQRGRRLEGILEQAEGDSDPILMAGEPMKASFQNIGNVPACKNHPPFSIKKEFFKRFPGLEERFKDRTIESLSDEDWTEIYNHKLPGYTPSGGVEEFIDYIKGKAAERLESGQTLEDRPKDVDYYVLQPGDIIPTCGAAHAIGSLRETIRDSRFLHITPGYPAQIQRELANARLFDKNAQPLGSNLEIADGKWQPNLDDIRSQLEASEKETNPRKKISVISIIHPSNPTGHLWEEKDLRALFRMAKEFGVMIESDETYWQVLNPKLKDKYVSAGVIAAQEGVPTVVHRSASKDALKCGEKLGWSECYNMSRDPRYKRVKKGLYNLQEAAVGATAIQRVVAEIYTDPEYEPWLEGFNKDIFETSGAIKGLFDDADIEGVTCIEAEGAMYTNVIFNQDILANAQQCMELEDPRLEAFVDKEMEDYEKDQAIDKSIARIGKVKTKEMPPDEKFLTWLMAKTGVVVSPISGFGGKYVGFRICNFEDAVDVNKVFGPVVEAVREYLKPKDSEPVQDARPAIAA